MPDLVINYYAARWNSSATSTYTVKQDKKNSSEAERDRMRYLIRLVFVFSICECLLTSATYCKCCACYWFRLDTVV